MPTSAELLLDTSAAVELMTAGTPSHEAVLARTDGLVLGLAGHAVFETYSVLTRLPGARRVDPAAARGFMADNFPADVFLTDDASAAALERLAAVGIAGGAVYDGLIGLAAASVGVMLLSRDRRAASTYRVLGVEFELL